MNSTSHEDNVNLDLSRSDVIGFIHMSKQQIDLTFRVLERLGNTLHESRIMNVTHFFQTWKDNVFMSAQSLEDKVARERAMAESKAVNELVNTLASTKCGFRTDAHLAKIKSSLVHCLHDIKFNELRHKEMSLLCNEVDWIPVRGQTLVFLQGDYGDCYYMVASGTVDLYLETSQHRAEDLQRLYTQVASYLHSLLSYCMFLVLLLFFTYAHIHTHTHTHTHSILVTPSLR